MNTETMFSSDKDYWETPTALFNAGEGAQVNAKEASK